MRWGDPYHMLKNLFELIALKGNGGRKTLAMCTHTQGFALVPTVSTCTNEPPGETLTTQYLC